MSNFRYFSFQLLREAQVFIHLFILPNFRCLSSQFPQEAPVPPASDIYAEVSYKKGEFWFGTQKHIFDKLLDNFTSNNIHHQMLLFADKQNFEKYFGLQAKALISKCCWKTKNIFVTKYSGLQSKLYFVTKYSVLQAKNWAGELISGQTRAGKILVKYTILDLLHTRKIGDEMRK